MRLPARKRLRWASYSRSRSAPGGPLEHPAHVPGGAQAGEAVVEGLLLGLAEHVHHGAGIEAAAGEPGLAPGQEDEGAAVAFAA